MQGEWVPTVLLWCLSVVTVLSPVGEQNGTSKLYPYGTASCLEGNAGSGFRLFLTQKLRCEGKVECPYLEVDITEQPVPVHKSITIGKPNRAFRCRKATNGCEEAVSGNLIFDRFEENSAKSLQTDGHYDLKFSTGDSESGLFKVTCFAPCG